MIPKHGIYEATMVHTRQADGRNGPGGYFGVQWKGTSSKADTLIFSIWDEKEEMVIPLLTPNEEARNETEPGSMKVSVAKIPSSLFHGGGQELYSRPAQ